MDICLRRGWWRFWRKSGRPPDSPRTCRPVENTFPQAAVQARPTTSTRSHRHAQRPHLDPRFQSHAEWEKFLRTHGHWITLSEAAQLFLVHERNLHAIVAGGRLVSGQLNIGGQTALVVSVEEMALRFFLRSQLPPRLQERASSLIRAIGIAVAAGAAGALAGELASKLYNYLVLVCGIPMCGDGGYAPDLEQLVLIHDLIYNDASIGDSMTAKEHLQHGDWQAELRENLERRGLASSWS